MRIVKLVQRSPEWHAWRKAGMGSSDIAAIVGKSPYKTPYQVWESFMGLRDEIEINPAMQRGIDYEDEARDYLGDSALKPECIEHDNYHYFHASLDGLGDGYFVEIKVPSQKNFPSYKNKIPEHYYIQMQWQFLVSGLSKCTFLAYSPEGKTGFVHQVERDEELIEELERLGSKFWHDYENGISPELTKNDMIELSGQTIKEECINYQKWYEIKIKAEEECSKSKEALLKFGEGNSFKAYGIKCIKINPRSSYDIEAMKRDGIDVEKYKKISDKESFMLRVESSD